MKATRLLYAAAARRDLSAIRDYLRERASSAVAARVIQRIRARIGAAREAPLAGVGRPEFGATCRFVIVHPYLIYYAFDSGEMIVLRILHWAQDRDSILQG